MALTTAPFAGDDPWKASALISALSQLLLAILFLLQTVVACLTLQVIKYFGLGNSCWYATYGHYFNSPSLAGHLPHEFKEKGAFRCGHFRPLSRSGASSSSQPSSNSNLYKLIRGLEASLTRTVSTERGFLVRRQSKTREDENFFNGLENRESVLSRSRNQDWCGPKITSLVCPNCNAAWTVTRPPMFKDAKDVLQVRTHWEDGLADNKEEGFHATSPVNTDEQWESAGREGVSAKTQEENKECAGCQVSHELEAKVSCHKEMQLPAKKFGLQAEEVVEGALNEKIEEPVRHVSPFLVQDREESSSPLCNEQTGSDIAGVETRKLFSGIPESLRSKLASSFREVAEETSVIGTSGSVENCDRLMETEADLETEGDYGCSADVIIGLRNALQMERKALCALYEEFEEERSAAETAANEAIGMISRLQEEKAVLQMKSAHYQRMAEEKAIYDEQAMQLLKEVLYKRERENFVLEKEVKLFKRRFFREVSRATKRRKEFENPSLSLIGREPMLLLECSAGASVSKEHQEVSTADLEVRGVEQKCKEFENPSLSVSGRESMLLLECSEGASVSKERQEVSTADLEVPGVEQKCNISHGVGSGEKSLAKLSFRTEIIDEQPHKRLKGFTEHAGESNGYGLPCLLDGSSDMPFSTLQGANEFEQVCKGSFSHMEQVEQIQQTPGMPGSAMDEDDTNIILHQLMALEEQLHALGEADEFEPHNLAQFLENHPKLDAMESTSIASVDKDQIIVDSSRFDGVRILSAQKECKAVRCNEKSLISMTDGFCNPPGMVECPEARYFDKSSNLDIDITTSRSWSREGAQMCTVHDTDEIPLREDTIICSLHCESNVTTQDNLNPARKPHCLSYFSHDEVTTANSGTSINNVTQDSSLAPSSDAEPIRSSVAHSQQDIIGESWQCQSHSKYCISEDDKGNFTGKEVQELKKRLQVLENEGVLEGNPSTSPNPKDVGISLLKELSQQLQELPLANSNTDSVQVVLPVPADSCFQFTSKTDTIIRKRQFLNGPGQT